MSSKKRKHNSLPVEHEGSNSIAHLGTDLTEGGVNGEHKRSGGGKVTGGGGRDGGEVRCSVNGIDRVEPSLPLNGVFSSKTT